MPKSIDSSMESIERIGGKLSYLDFRDFLKVVANSFPSGTEEYQFLTDLLLTEKTDVSFVRKMFSLLDEAPKITDADPEGFSWELLSPSTVGASVYKKIDEIDPNSARDLYEFMSYVFMNYTTKELEEDQPFSDNGEGKDEGSKETLPKNPSFRTPDVVDATPVPKPGVDQTAIPPVPAFLKGVNYTQVVDLLLSLVPAGESIDSSSITNEFFRLLKSDVVTSSSEALKIAGDLVSIVMEHKKEGESVDIMAAKGDFQGYFVSLQDSHPTPINLEAVKSAVSIQHVTSFPKLLEIFPDGFGMTSREFQHYIDEGPVIAIEAANGAKLAWHKGVGFVNEQDDVMDPTEVQRLVGPEDYAELMKQMPDTGQAPIAQPPQAQTVPVEESFTDDPFIESADQELESAIEGKISINSLMKRRHFQLNTRPRKKGAREGQLVIVKGDILLYVEQGTKGEVVGIPEHGKVLVQLEGSDIPFEKPVVLPDFYLTVVPDFDDGGMDSEGHPEGGYGGDVFRGKQEPKARGSRKGTSTESYEPGFRGSGLETMLPADAQRIFSLFGRKRSLQVGQKVVVRKNCKVVIPKGTVGRVEGFESSRDVIVNFGRNPELPIREPIACPVKYFRISQSKEIEGMDLEYLERVREDGNDPDHITASKASVQSVSTTVCPTCHGPLANGPDGTPFCPACAKKSADHPQPQERGHMQLGQAAEPVQSAIPFNDPKTPTYDKTLRPETEDRILKMKPHLHRGSIVRGLTRDIRNPGARPQKVGSILELKYNDQNLPASYAKILWQDGAETEIPMGNITALLFKDVKSSGSTLALMSSYREVNGTVSFVLTGMAPAKLANTFHQVFSGRVELPKTVFKRLAFSSKTRLYSGKDLKALFSKFDELHALIAVNQALPMTAEIECPSCKGKNPVGTTKCGKCGYSLDKQGIAQALPMTAEIECPKCGSVVGNASGHVTCPKCGYHIDPSGLAQSVRNGFIAQKAFRFGKTFVTEKAGVIVKSGPYGMFAVKVPVVFSKNATRYTMFKKIGNSYVSDKGFRFKAIQAARFGKPQYLLVAQTVPEFFMTRGAITCNATKILERTQFILQRKSVRSAILAQKKLHAEYVKNRRQVIEGYEFAKQDALRSKGVAVNQSKMIDILNARLVESKKSSQTPASEQIDREAISSARAARLAERMARL